TNRESANDSGEQREGECGRDRKRPNDDTERRRPRPHEARAVSNRTIEERRDRLNRSGRVDDEHPLEEGEGERIDDHGSCPGSPKSGPAFPDGAEVREEETLSPDRRGFGARRGEVGVAVKPQE